MRSLLFLPSDYCNHREQKKTKKDDKNNDYRVTQLLWEYHTNHNVTVPDTQHMRDYGMPDTGQQLHHHLSAQSSSYQGPVIREEYSEPAGYDSSTPPSDNAVPAASQDPNTILTSDRRDAA